MYLDKLYAQALEAIDREDYELARRLFVSIISTQTDYENAIGYLYFVIKGINPIELQRKNHNLELELEELKTRFFQKESESSIVIGELERLKREVANLKIEMGISAREEANYQKEIVSYRQILQRYKAQYGSSLAEVPSQEYLFPREKLALMVFGLAILMPILNIYSLDYGHFIPISPGGSILIGIIGSTLAGTIARPHRWIRAAASGAVCGIGAIFGAILYVEIRVSITNSTEFSILELIIPSILGGIPGGILFQRWVGKR